MPYHNHPIPVAVECLMIGFDGINYRLLLTQNTSSSETHNWSLPADFLAPDEDMNRTCIRILNKVSGVKKPFIEQLHTYLKPKQFQGEPIMTTAFISLMDMDKFKHQLFPECNTEWFTFKELSWLTDDHHLLLQLGKHWLRYKATLHPILLELLPEKFTLRQLFALYKITFKMEIDKRNFNKKFLSSGLLLKQEDKEKENSKRGAHFFKLDKNKYKECWKSPFIVINPEKFLDTQSMQLFNHRKPLNSMG